MFALLIRLPMTDNRRKSRFVWNPNPGKQCIYLFRRLNKEALEVTPEFRLNIKWTSCGKRGLLCK